MALDYSTQIAIIAGVLGSICVLLAIGMIVLWIMIRRLREKLAETRARELAANANKPNTNSTVLDEEAMSRKSYHLSSSNLSRSDDGLSSKYSLYVTQPGSKVNGAAPVLPTYSYPVRPSSYQRNNQAAKYDSPLSTPPTVASSRPSRANNVNPSIDSSTPARTRSSTPTFFNY